MARRPGQPAPNPIVGADTKLIIFPGLNGGPGNQLNMLAGQNNPAAAMHFAQMQAKLAEFHSQAMQNGEKSDESGNEDDERLSGKSDLESRSPSPSGQHEDQDSGDENGSDRSTPPSWAFKMGCNFCNKVFSSSTELGQHIKDHYRERKMETSRSPTSAASELAA